MKTSTAYAPGHLTGLFQICDQPADPVLKGSRGSGVSVALGVYSKVTAEPSNEPSRAITINGKLTSKAFVSEYVLDKLAPRMPRAMKLTVEHTIETPLGAGFGSSGGGALTLALAANEATGCGLTRLEAERLAHVADIECRTGLGSVAAAVRGGFGVTYKPGGPGISEAKMFGDTSAYRTVYVYYAPIETKSALADPSLRVKINELGGCLVDELAEELTVERFMERSRSFTDHVGLATPRLKKCFRAGDAAGVTFTMAMFGEVAFTVVEKEETDEVVKIIEGVDPGCEPIIVGIDDVGARMV